MKFLKTALLSLLLASSSFAFPGGVAANKTYTSPPELENFRYWYGDIDEGYLIYLGKSDISDFETELHIYFANKKATKVLLILGPAGLDNSNCVKKYKAVIKLLNKKYGHYVYQRELKDPIIEDLVSVSICTPVKLELYSLETIWRSKNLSIVANLIGDDSGFYIEIEYLSGEKIKSSKLKQLL